MGCLPVLLIIILILFIIASDDFKEDKLPGKVTEGVVKANLVNAQINSIKSEIKVSNVLKQ